MSLQIVYGRAHGGKTQYVLDYAKKIIDENKSVIIVVPEQFTHIAEKRFISRVGSIEQNKSEVLSFDRIAKKINAKFPNRKKQLNCVGKSLIVSEILSSAKLEYYSNSAKSPGFIEACVDEISEMKKYNITPGTLKEIIEKNEDKSLGMKLSDLMLIYEAYDNKVKNEYSDSDDSLNILNEILNNHKPYENYTFLFDEFSAFNPVERSVIVSLCRQCENVVITICGEPDNDDMSVFQPTLAMADTIVSECEAAGCSVLKPIVLTGTFYDNRELMHLEKNIYKNPPTVFDGQCKNIRVFSSENPYTEVMRVASQILALVRERNVRFREISVVCSDISSYSHIFRSVFDRYNIPYFIDEKSRVLDHAVINFVINILDVYTSGYTSETVVNFLKSGYTCDDKEAIYAADNFITATNASKNTWLFDEKWEKVTQAYTGGDVALTDKLNFIRNEYILPLSVLHEKIKGKNSVKDITRSLYTYLAESGFCKAIESYISHFKSENRMSMAKQYESVWKILIEAFDTLVYILGDKKVNIKQYRSYLFTAFGQQKIGIIPTSLDEIIIGDVLRSKSEYVSYQFVLGANDGCFPSPESDTGIVDDKDKSALKQIGVEFSPDTKQKAYFNRFLIYSLFTHPQKTLIISYPLSDTGFSSMRPAFAVTTLKSIFKDLEVNCFINEEVDLYHASEDSAEELLAICAGAITDKRSCNDGWQDVYAYFNENDKSRINKINSFIKNSNQLTRLEPEIVNTLFKNEFYSTVSRIQRYNSCRYSYYLEYMLKLKEKKTYGLEATDFGTFVHEILEKILTEITSDKIPFENTDKNYFETKVDALIEEYVNNMLEYGGEVTEREIYSVTRYKDAIVNTLMLIRMHIVSSEFTPIGHEIVFGDDNNSCIDIPLDNGKTLKITGKIDRADSFENEDGTFIRIIDYKTGNKSFDYSEVYYGTDIQLLVYLDALVQKTPNAHHAGVLYLRIQNPVARFSSVPDEEKLKKELDKECRMSGLISNDSNVIRAYDKVTAKLPNQASLSQFKMLSDYVKSSVRSSAQALCDGQIQINPYFNSSSNETPDSCVFCPFSAICNRESLGSEDYRYFDKIDKKNIWSAINDREVKKDELD